MRTGTAIWRRKRLDTMNRNGNVPRQDFADSLVGRAVASLQP